MNAKDWDVSFAGQKDLKKSWRITLLFFTISHQAQKWSLWKQKKAMFKAQTEIV